MVDIKINGQTYSGITDIEVEKADGSGNISLSESGGGMSGYGELVGTVTVDSTDGSNGSLTLPKSYLVPNTIYYLVVTNPDDLVNGKQTKKICIFICSDESSATVPKAASGLLIRKDGGVAGTNATEDTTNDWFKFGGFGSYRLNENQTFNIYKSNPIPTST